MQNQSNYELLLRRLDEFIRKYYLNLLIKGSLIVSGLLVALFIFFTLSEFLFHFGTVTRKILFWTFVISAAYTGARYIVLPLLHYFKLGKTISHERAAQIIGDHFEDVKDRLLNILQLGNNKDAQSQELIHASINQKIELLKPVPIKRAIDFSENKKYLKYAAIPVLGFLVLLLGSPDVIREGTHRIINNNIHYTPNAPFDFVILNDSLEFIQYTDVNLKVSTEGSVMPEEMYIEIEGRKYRLNKGKRNSFSYTIPKIQQTSIFQLSANGYYSKPYQIVVIPKPGLISFETKVIYPEYLNAKDDVFENVGDITVPEGSLIKWVFKTRNTDRTEIRFSDTLFTASKSGKHEYTFERIAKESTVYRVYVGNKEISKADSIDYSLVVIPDRYPSIIAEEIKDSVNTNFIYFSGRATDDHGISQLNFAYEIIRDGKAQKPVYSPVKYNRGGKVADFNHYWNVNDASLEPGDQLNYYFIVWDNDGINGHKSTKSKVLSLEKVTEKQFDEETNTLNTAIKDELQKAIKESKEIKDELKDLQDKMKSRKEISWEDKKKIEELIERQKNLESKVKNVKEDYKENISKQSEYKEPNEELVKKQEKIQELFEELIPEELKDMFRQMEDMMEEMANEEMMENMEEFEFSEENLEKELDRMLALFKQLEFEQKLDDAINKLDKLADEQKQLSEETEQGDKDNADLQEEQQALNEKFDDVKKELEELENLNEELESPNDMEDTDQQQENISNEMENAQEQLEQNKNQKAKENQQNAADQMEMLAQQLQQMQQSMQQEQLELDMEAIRQLLENLVKLSFDQENLMDEIRDVNINDPRYVTLVQEQYKLKDDAKMIEDSLFALSKRVFQIESFINEQIAAVNKNLEESIDELEARKKAKANGHQQYVMTAVNNLALMLSETLESMQNQMASMMPGNQQCQKPGGKSGKIPKLSKMQEQLNQQLQDMQEGMKQGKKPGQKGKGMSQQMAEMAAKQRAIREALKKINAEDNKDGRGSLGDLQNAIDEMDKTEEDLVNKRITEEMVKRQQEILTRLLEAEEAERQREKDDKRKSEVANNYEREVPADIEEYLKKREAQLDYYKTLPPTLKPFYRDLVEEYFKTITE